MEEQIGVRLLTRTMPASPRDLLHHRCIRFRHRGEGVYKWELDKDDESLEIAVHGSLILDELDLLIQATVDGAGVASSNPPRCNGRP